MNTAFAPLQVTVTDQFGNDLPGATVLFVAPTSGASGTFSNGLTSITETTTIGGIATAPFTANTKAGVYTVGASVGFVSTNFSLTNTADASSEKISYVSGDNQSGQIGSQIALTVQVTDKYGNPFVNVPITWTIVSGGGSTTGGNTGANGQATATATLGGGDAIQQFQASNSSFGSVTFSDRLSSLVVTTTSDVTNPNDNVLTLREAIADANVFGGTNIITFAPNVTGTITLLGSSGGRLDSSNGNLTIQGPGAGVLAVSGGNNSQVFNLSGGNTYAISGLTITGGGNTGGGVSIGAGDIATLTNDTISGNSATTGGGIYNAGTLVLTGCTLTGNTATGHAGALDNIGTATLNNCTLSGNSAPSGGAGGIANEGGTLTLNYTTLSGNNAGKNGGAITNKATVTLNNCTLSGNSATLNGGAIQNHSGTLSLSNTTLAGNQAESGGGIYFSGGNLTLASDTIAYNQSTLGKGGGVYIKGGTVQTYNAIFAGNSAKTTSPDFSGTVTTDKGNNLVGNASGSTGFTGTGDILNPVNGPGLGSLQNNGGPTQTVALLPNSPAINHGNPLGAPSTDQRGYPRNLSGPTSTSVPSRTRASYSRSRHRRLQFLAPTPAMPPRSTSARLAIPAAATSGSSLSTGATTPPRLSAPPARATLARMKHTYTAAGSPTLTVTVSDANNNFQQTTFGVTVHSAITFGTTSLPVGTVGDTYNTSLRVSGGSGSYTFGTSGNVPPDCPSTPAAHWSARRPRPARSSSPSSPRTAHPTRSALPAKPM